jgi:hypothetical protein
MHEGAGQIGTTQNEQECAGKAGTSEQRKKNTRTSSNGQERAGRGLRA